MPKKAERHHKLLPNYETVKILTFSSAQASVYIFKWATVSDFAVTFFKHQDIFISWLILLRIAAMFFSWKIQKNKTIEIHTNCSCVRPVANIQHF